MLTSGSLGSSWVTKNYDLGFVNFLIRCGSFVVFSLILLILVLCYFFETISGDGNFSSESDEWQGFKMFSCVFN